MYVKLYVDRAEISAQSPDSQKTSDFEKEEIFLTWDVGRGKI